MKFSVIIPIYNAENYIAETVSSIINQDIGFEKFVEIILINDGSTDHSEYVCKLLSSKYPDNIKYYCIERSGVSAARNYGIQNATGEYINFTDADDKWDKSAFRLIYEQIQINPDIDIFVSRMKFFEQKISYPKTDFRFIGDKCKIDITKHSNYIQMNCGNCIIKKECIKALFDISVSVAEDMLFINQILVEKKVYFLVKKAIFYHRIRINNSSVMQNMFRNREYYINTIDKISRFLMLYRADNSVYEYIIHLVMYDLHWRLNASIDCKLTYDEMKHYKKTLKDLAKNINIKIILKNKTINLQDKIKIILLKI